MCCTVLYVKCGPQKNKLIAMAADNGNPLNKQINSLKWGHLFCIIHPDNVMDKISFSITNHTESVESLTEMKFIPS